MGGIHRRYLAGFDAHMLGSTEEAREAGRHVMNGCLPFVFAVAHAEHLLDTKPPRGPAPRHEGLARLIADVK